MEMASFFGHNKWVAQRQGHRNLEFHIVHLLEPAPLTQTATAHLQTTWTVYFDGQGTQILPCGKKSHPHPPRGGGGGDIGWLMVYYLSRSPAHTAVSACRKLTQITLDTRRHQSQTVIRTAYQ